MKLIIATIAILNTLLLANQTFAQTEEIKQLVELSSEMTEDCDLLADKAVKSGSSFPKEFQVFVDSLGGATVRELRKEVPQEVVKSIIFLSEFSIMLQTSQILYEKQKYFIKESCKRFKSKGVYNWNITSNCQAASSDILGIHTTFVRRQGHTEPRALYIILSTFLPLEVDQDVLDKNLKEIIEVILSDDTSEGLKNNAYNWCKNKQDIRDLVYSRMLLAVLGN